MVLVGTTSSVERDWANGGRVGRKNGRGVANVVSVVRGEKFVRGVSREGSKPTKGLCF